MHADLLKNIERCKPNEKDHLEKLIAFYGKDQVDIAISCAKEQELYPYGINYYFAYGELPNNEEDINGVVRKELRFNFQSFMYKHYQIELDETLAPFHLMLIDSTLYKED